MMRKFLAAVVLASTPVMAGGVAPAFATPPSAVTQANVVTKWVKEGVTLNVRSGPGTSYGTVGTVKGNTALTGTLTNNGWFKITSGSFAGRYVSASYLTATSPQSVVRWVTAASLNVRTGPSTSYAKVGVLTLNQEAVGVLTNSGWMKLTAGPFSGRYVSTGYLTATKPSPPPGVPDGPASLWVKAGGPASVYEQALTSSKVVGSLYGNTPVQGVVTKGWLKITSASYAGRYMPTTSLTVVNPNPVGTEGVQWVKASGSASVRQSASAASTKLATLPANTQVKGVVTNGWLRITSGGHLNHYVAAGELSTSKPAVSLPISNTPVARVLGPYAPTLTATPEWRCQVKSGDAGLKEWPAKVRTRISKQFGINNIGGYRPTATGEHGLGLALDVMTPSVSALVGDDVASWTVANASKLNVKYVIWKQAIWLPSSGWQPMADRGSITQNHYDHVHVSFNSGNGTCAA